MNLTQKQIVQIKECVDKLFDSFNVIGTPGPKFTWSGSFPRIAADMVEFWIWNDAPPSKESVKEASKIAREYAKTLVVGMK